MAWIYQRGARWWIGWREGGRLVQQSLKTTSREVADQALAKLKLAEQAKQAGLLTEEFVAGLTGQDLAHRTTVADYFAQWLESARTTLSPHTVAKYEQVAAEFLASLPQAPAQMRLAEVTAEHVRQFLTAKSRRAALSTVRGFRRILSGLFARAQNEGQISGNPVALVKLPRARKGDSARRAFTLAELRQLHETADAFWQWMVVLGFYTGLALGDLVTLRLGNVDHRQRTITIRRRKTGTRVCVPYGERVAALLLPRTGQRPDDYFWPDQAERYERFGAGPFSLEFYQIMARCGLVPPRKTKHRLLQGRANKRRQTGLGFHCLRHTFVSFLKISGAVDSVAKELAGHESAAVSASYTHLPPATLADAVRRLPSI
jgi:integrase